MSSDDAWNLPISVVVFSKLNLELAHCIIASLHGVFAANGRKVKFVGFMENKYYSKVKTHRLLHYVRETASIWGISDSKLPEIVVEEIAPHVFDDIRAMSGVTDGDLLNSLEPLENKESMFKIDESAGKSGSFFLFTSDNKIAIKTIKTKERKAMKKILKHYHGHLSRYKNSMLCRILGLYTIKVPGVATLNIILMQNILYDISPIRLFDIKGSTVGRTAYKDGKLNGPYKDLDFIKIGEILELSEEEKNRMKAAVLCDVHFLHTHKLMDYSLLLAISKFKEGCFYTHYHSIDQTLTYTMGIIDFLTEYNY